MDNEELYRRCVANDEAAWETVYNYVLAIARLPRWRLRESPRDMAQSIVLFLIEKGIGEVRQPAAFRGFIRMVAHRKILDSFKKKQPATTQYHADIDYMNINIHDAGQHHPADGPGEDISPDLVGIITAALDDLPAYCRQVIPQYFKYKLGFIASFRELSEILASPPGTVSAQITRCLRRLARTPDLITYYREN
jgi:RNA polymerase sigma factor (sigma-70 family)